MRWSAVKLLVRRVRGEIASDHLELVSGGVAFFGFLALFPALAALIAIYGLVFDPAQVQEQMGHLERLLPTDAHSLVSEQLQRLASAAPRSLSFGVIVGFVIALWSANKGMRGMIEAINLAYDATDSRGFFARHVFTLSLTLGTIVFFVLTVALAAGIPALFALLGLENRSHVWIAIARWPLLVAIAFVAVCTLYRFVPAKRASPRRFLTVGSAFATVALLLASIGFSLYVSRVGDYNHVYGSLGAVAIFLFWLYIASFVVLLGAEIDAEIQRQPNLDLFARRARAPLAQPSAAHR